MQHRVNAVIAATMMEYSEQATRPQHLGVDTGIIEQILEASKSRAHSRGSTTVTPRDVAEAARALKAQGTPPVSPAEEIPQHYDELMTDLAALREWVDNHVQAGNRRPRVLICGERHSVVAKMFSEAGADVATNDLHPTDTPGIPHYQGDMNRVLDQGWDLIIGHPPCTYLANVAVAALQQDRQRVREMNHSADLFRRIYHSDAPFIAVENPTMHRSGRQRAACGRPNQYVQPFQHGTGHQKRTGLHLKGGLPLLQPTCPVPGRARPMANLPDTPHRSDLRSRTYIGVAAAMALQWMPTLVTHVTKREPTETTPPPTAFDLIQRARSATLQRRVQIWYTRRQSGQNDQVYGVNPTGESIFTADITGVDALEVPYHVPTSVSGHGLP